MDNIIVNSLFLETTNRCNLFCQHCYNNSGHSMPIDIEMNQISKLFYEARDLQVSKICISGGEPLLNPNIKRIFDLSKQLEVDIQLITNGTLMERYLQIICENPWISVQTSIDGIEKTHDMLRGNGAFSKTHANVSELYKLGKRWALKCTITNYNKNELEDIIDFGMNNGAYIVSFSLLNIQGRTKDNQNIILSNTDIIEVCENLEKLKSIYKDKIEIESPKIDCNDSCPFTNSSNKLKVSPRIDVYGNVYFCSMVDNIMLSLGNIYQSSLVEILRGEHSRDVFNFVNAYYKVNKCRNCFINTLCQKGCPGTYFNNLPTYSDDFCKVRREQTIRWLRQT